MPHTEDPETLINDVIAARKETLMKMIKTSFTSISTWKDREAGGVSGDPISYGKGHHTIKLIKMYRELDTLSQRQLDEGVSPLCQIPKGECDTCTRDWNCYGGGSRIAKE